MQRRARIKAVANLSNVRRGTSKNSTENSQESENSKKDVKEQLNDIQEKTPSENEQIVTVAVKNEAVSQETSSSSVDKDDDVNTSNNLLDKLNEKSIESDNNDKSVTQNEILISEEVIKDVPNKQESFKTPVHATPRAENASSSNKFRKPKIAPRLNIARAVSKAVQEVVDEKPKENDVIVEAPILSPIHTEKAPESPINCFSPPSTPFSPPPNRQRPETPREILDSPGFIINHNLHHPPTPQSPFYPTPHSRIRTESLCSVKSATVANLQPRKKVRTEDQKILDNKRESRERLSNKKIEKSQLRMFDMIYYNPTTNPMKPRATPSAKDKPSPKKIDLTMDLPPPTPPPQETSNAIAVPQLKLNADGELVLDEASLVVENEEQKKNRILLANTNVVYHDELSGTYGYYKRQQRTKEWPQEETIKFYRCLNTVGTDFSLMLNLFPNRSRRDLKLKFKKEEKNNPNLVDKALLNHNTFDIEELQRELDEEDEIRRKEAESKSSEVKELVKRKILKKQEAKAKARQNDKAKIEKILSDGDLVLNSVDNHVQDVKENMEKSEAAGKRKRAPKRKNVKNEPSMEFKKIMLHARINESISVHELKKQESVSIDISVPKEQPEPKTAIVYEEVTEMTEETLIEQSNITANSSMDSTQPETSTMSIVTKIEKEYSILSAESSYDPSIASKPSFQSSVISMESSYVKHEISPHPSILYAEPSYPTISGEPSYSPLISYDPSMLSVKPSYSPSMISMEPSYNPSIISAEPSYDWPSISAEPSTVSTQETNDPTVSVEFTNNSVICMEPTTERVCIEDSVPMSTVSFNWPSISVEPSLCPSTLSVQETNDQTVSAEFTNNSVICMDTEPERVCIEDTEPEKICIEDTEPERICIEDTEPERVCVEETKPSCSPSISYEPSMLSVMPSYSSSMISMEHSYNPSIISAEPSTLSVQESNNPAISGEFTNNSVICTEPEPERVCIEDTEPTEEEPLDDESFLNSLDLERLVIVVKQINGKDFYDIHETDGDMQNLSDKPLNLPRHIVDLIVDAMTQDD